MKIFVPAGDFVAIITSYVNTNLDRKSIEEDLNSPA